MHNSEDMECQAPRHTKPDMAASGSIKCNLECILIKATVSKQIRNSRRIEHKQIENLCCVLSYLNVNIIDITKI